MKTENDQNIRNRSKLTKTFVYGALAAWLLLALLMGAAGKFAAGAGGPPIALGLSFALPIIFFTLAYADRGAFWEFCQWLDLKFITGIQFWRIIGADFLLQYANGHMPARFAFPAGIGDVIVGAAAIPLALGLAKGGPATKKWFIAWNIFGLFDLFSAVALGILHSPSSLGVLAGDGPTTFLMSELPRSIIPTFLVPLFVLLHFLSLARKGEVAGHAGIPRLVEQPS